MSLIGKASGKVLRGRAYVPDTIHGKSAYEIAVMHGFEGTEEEWLDTLMDEAKEEVKEELITLIKNLNRISYINLLAASWKQDEERLYSQVVDITGVTANSFIEICFTDEQLKTFSAKDISFTAVNKGGVVTVKCVGQKPTSDYRLQVKITEVSINE